MTFHWTSTVSTTLRFSLTKADARPTSLKLGLTIFGFASQELLRRLLDTAKAMAYTGHIPVFL
jgi:hypothetical protein